MNDFGKNSITDVPPTNLGESVDAATSSATFFSNISSSNAAIEAIYPASIASSAAVEAITPASISGDYIEKKRKTEEAVTAADMSADYIVEGIVHVVSIILIFNTQN